MPGASSGWVSRRLRRRPDDGHRILEPRAPGRPSVGRHPLDDHRSTLVNGGARGPSPTRWSTPSSTTSNGRSAPISSGARCTRRAVLGEGAVLPGDLPCVAEFGRIWRTADKVVYRSGRARAVIDRPRSEAWACMKARPGGTSPWADPASTARRSGGSSTLHLGTSVRGGRRPTGAVPAAGSARADRRDGVPPP